MVAAKTQKFPSSAHTVKTQKQRQAKIKLPISKGISCHCLHHLLRKGGCSVREFIEAPSFQEPP